MLCGIAGRDHGAPGVAHHVDARHLAPCADPVGGGGKVACGHFRIDDRMIRFGRLVHLRWAARSAIATDVDHVDVEALAGQHVHPRDALECQIETGLGRVGGTVHEEQHMIGAECVERSQTLVAHIELDARVATRHHELFHDQRCLAHLRGARDRRCGTNGGAVADGGERGQGAHCAQPAKQHVGLLMR